MPANVILNIIEPKPLEKAYKSKSRVLAVTAVLNFEQPTCLSANILIDSGNIEKIEQLPKKLVSEIKSLFSNKLITTDEYHTD
jgi:hypothetical protein